MGKKHKKQKSHHHTAEYIGNDKTPLKLVFKRGSEGTYDSDYATPGSPYSSESSHKKKRHYQIQSPGEARINIQSSEDLNSSSSETACNITTSSEAPKPPGKTSKKQSCLNRVLETLVKQLERKDTHEVFAWPVNDLIAPGYSAVIDEPMDFSTIKNKILCSEYATLNSFRRDFELMVDNCCVYNKPDTVYYQISKKMRSAGMKAMSKDKVLQMKRSLHNQLPKSDIRELLNLEAGEEKPPLVETEEYTNETAANSVEPAANEVDLRAHEDAISFTDADYEDTVGPEATFAAGLAREKILKKRPRTRLCFLGRDSEGGTFLNFLNPDRSETAVDLASFLSPVSDGIDRMADVKEDKRNKLTPIEYLSYGAFGSGAPCYDSRLSNITQEETDLLMSAYGGETGYLFAQSIQEFVSGANPGLRTMVGDMLDTVTHNAHSQINDDIIKKREKKKTPEFDFKSLRSLGELGINVDFLGGVEEKMKKKRVAHSVEAGLEQGALLCHKLLGRQNKRLSSRSSRNEPNLSAPTTSEREIADELRGALAGLAKRARPGELL